MEKIPKTVNKHLGFFQWFPDLFILNLLKYFFSINFIVLYIFSRIILKNTVWPGDFSIAKNPIHPLRFLPPDLNLFASTRSNNGRNESGATWLRRGLRNLECMPRRRSPRKYSCKPYSCQRRQLRFSCLKNTL